VWRSSSDPLDIREMYLIDNIEYEVQESGDKIRFIIYFDGGKIEDALGERHYTSILINWSILRENDNVRMDSGRFSGPQVQFGEAWRGKDCYCMTSLLDPGNYKLFVQQFY